MNKETIEKLENDYKNLIIEKEILSKKIEKIKDELIVSTDAINKGGYKGDLLKIIIVEKKDIELPKENGASIIGKIEAINPSAVKKTLDKKNVFDTMEKGHIKNGLFNLIKSLIKTQKIPRIQIIK